MKNNLGPSRRGKGAAVGLVICFVAVIALVGFFTFSRYKRDMSRQLAKAEEKTDTEEKQKDIKETEKSQTTNSQAIQNKAQETEKQKEETQTQTEQRQNQTSPTATQPDALAFSENDLLAWPVDGLQHGSDDLFFYAGSIQIQSGIDYRGRSWNRGNGICKRNCKISGGQCADGEHGDDGPWKWL